MTTNRTDGLRTIAECARLFAKSIEWIRYQEASGNFRYEDNTRIEPIRSDTRSGIPGNRFYTLDMIEEMADSLKRKYVINKYQHERTVNVINAFRRLEE